MSTSGVACFQALSHVCYAYQTAHYCHKMKQLRYKHGYQLCANAAYFVQRKILKSNCSHLIMCLNKSKSVDRMGFKTSCPSNHPNLSLSLCLRLSLSYSLSLTLGCELGCQNMQTLTAAAAGPDGDLDLLSVFAGVFGLRTVLSWSVNCVLIMTSALLCWPNSLTPSC